ncbi:helicase-associated domain-containing protein [Micromonospora sp. CPCC 206061]|uniref:helicase-associated domain-containing protein n=1 Tax=Micromonospora sp. CPCC 206061 TaxID=3122410 RepID=UPI002FEF1FA2
MECTTARLAALVGVAEDDQDLAAALRRLTELVLIWPHAGGLAAAHLSAVWPYPLELGPSAAELLTTQNMNELRKLAKLYGIPTAGRGKDELIASLASWLAQPENVRGLAAQAPAEVHAQLAALARRPASPFDLRGGIIYGSPGTALPWAAERGLVVRSAWGIDGIPREVAIALREGRVAPFDPKPPAVSVTPADLEAAEREAAAAASETLAAITAIVETMSAGPVPLLKTGGLGVRELRRLAKSSDQDEDRTRLTIELLAAGGLTDASHGGITPALSYDEFTAAEPAAQLLDIVQTWLAMPACPLAPTDPNTTSPRLLYWDEDEEMTLTGLRSLTLRTLVDAVPEGQATDPATLADRLAWQSPILTDQTDEDLHRYTTGIWREAHRLGLLAHGTVTRFCRSLVTGDPVAALRHAEAMLPRNRSFVLLQNDLTAVVTGTPSANLLALLDSMAAPESRSGAWTWRFSPASIRAAVDAGSTPAELLTRITEVADGGRVPQTLAYLIDDVARRYGRVQVRPTGCCLCSEDEVLLTEILNTRSLQSLHLVRLAPTVLASARPQAETLAALRAAGHAPAGLSTDGAPAIEIPQRRRAAPPPNEPHSVDLVPLPRLSDPAELARTLLSNR